MSKQHSDDLKELGTSILRSVDRTSADVPKSVGREVRRTNTALAKVCRDFFNDPAVMRMTNKMHTGDEPSPEEVIELFKAVRTGNEAFVKALGPISGAMADFDAPEDHA